MVQARQASAALAWSKCRAVSGWTQATTDAPHDQALDTLFLAELARAEAHFKEVFVGLAYFLKNWGARPPFNTFPASSPARQRALKRLLEAKFVETYDVGDKTALRRKR
jgi:hypothetical protein